MSTSGSSSLVRLGHIDEFSADALSEIVIDKMAYLVVRKGADLFVTAGRCPHMSAHLVRGTLEDEIITCPAHGSQFNVRTGECVRWTEFHGAVLEIVELVRHPRPLPVFQVTVDEEGIVWAGPQLNAEA